MESVIRLVPLSWVVPRLVAIAVCMVWLYGLGWVGPRMFRRGRYSTAVRIDYALSVVGFVAVGIGAAVTL